MRLRLMLSALLAALTPAPAGTIPLPPRPGNAPGGAEFARSVAGLEPAARERAIEAQAALGNVPDFWRRFVEVSCSRSIEDREVRASYFVAPDYFAIGRDDDYVLFPLSPLAAQAIADKLDCILPTRRMVDDIHAAAGVKLIPSPIPPGPAMTTVAVFLQHNDTVRRQRAAWLERQPWGALVAGHKKDLVLTPRLAGAPGRVALYGWHQPDGKPIQPLYLGHGAEWVDYSHGARFVQRQMTVNGRPTTVDAVLADAKLSPLLSDEGPLPVARYVAGTPGGRTNTNTDRSSAAEPAPAGARTNRFGEREVTLRFAPDVRVVLNWPAALDPAQPVRLVLYALPNGNSIEQTIGQRNRPGADEHFDFQHIGAQTRWLRRRLDDATLVVAYLECAGKAWPAWRRQNDPDGRRIGAMVDALRRQVAGPAPRLVLSGHSGGGSFTFGFLDGVQRIPDDIERIAFLDSNYAYNAARGHATKLARWLAASTNHYLCVLAYHDSVARLNGKPFVSENGGTWGRSLAMIRDLGEAMPFLHETDADWQRHTALAGRVKFFLRENPAKAILHTVQVEKNGFIHALLTGTALENRDYVYFGPRAYEDWIEGE